MSAQLTTTIEQTGSTLLVDAAAIEQDRHASMRQPVRFRLGHRPALDGLRGIFVLLVVGVHGGFPFMSGGMLGVDGFFVLSGFLITSLLLEEWQGRGSINLKAFYARRALRLLPALYAMLLVCSVITIVGLAGDAALDSWRGILLSFLYCSNWFTVFFGEYNVGLGLMGHTWSLAIEEQFYLVWPVLLIGLIALVRSFKRLAVCTAALVVGAALWRAWLASGGHITGRILLGSDTRADELFVGCTIAALAVGGLVGPGARMVWVTRGLAIGAVGVLTCLVLDSAWYFSVFPYYGGYTLIALSAGALILHLLISPEGRLAKLLSWRPLVQVGVVSYGIYLWHYPVFNLLRAGPAGGLDWPIQIARLAITATLVFCSYLYLEKPMLRIKERFAQATPADVRA